jgi:hypothetical protein
MYRMIKLKEGESMRGSPQSKMGELLVASNKLAYSGHQELPISPDLAGTHAVRGLLCDPPLKRVDNILQICAFRAAEPVSAIYFSASSALSVVKQDGV